MAPNIVNMSDKKENKLSYEYIRGLVEGEGCFSFCSTPIKKADGTKVKLPAFILSMSHQDKELIMLVKDRLCLRNRVYEYKRRLRKDNYNRQSMVMLIVRDFGQIKNIIVPLFYKKLHGNKAKQFEEWLEKIGNDPAVAENYKFIYKIFKAGFYDRNPKFTD